MSHYLISCGKNNIFQVRQAAPHPEQKTIIKEIYYLLVNCSKQLILKKKLKLICINLRLYLIETKSHESFVVSLGSLFRLFSMIYLKLY